MAIRPSAQLLTLWACALIDAISAQPVRADVVTACPLGEPPAFVIDESLRERDREPPAPFSELRAFTRRVSATRCRDNVCTSVSCGDAGHLELQFEPPRDGRDDTRDDTKDIGYRVVWISGHMPMRLQAAIDAVKTLSDTRSIALELGWDGVAELDGELALVAVDRAGNESAPSSPVHVTWSGCTSYWDDLSCPGEEPAIEASGCSVTRPARAPCLPLMAASVLGLCRSRRRRSRRAHGS